MATIIAKRVIDRSKYPKQMIFVDREGNVCVADRPKGMSEEERAERNNRRKADKLAYLQKKADLRTAMRIARLEARKGLNPDALMKFKKAKEAYEDFKSQG